MLRQQEVAEVEKGVDEGAVRVDQVEDDRNAVRSRDPGDVLREVLAVHPLLVANNVAPQARVVGLVGVGVQLPREQDIGGRERRAVAPDDSVAEFGRVGLGVRAAGD